MSETTKTVYEAVKQHRLNGKLGDIAVMLANDIRRRMGEVLTERQMIGVDYLNTFIYDPALCGSHDYTDANLPIFEAIGDFCEREFKVDRETFMEEALVNDDESSNDFAVVDLMNLGWNEVKKGGFSQLWNATDDTDLRRDIGLLVLEVPPTSDIRTTLLRERGEENQKAFERMGADTDMQDKITDIVQDDLGPEAVLAVLQSVAAARKRPKF
jgi:hypothetical protein